MTLTDDQITAELEKVHGWLLNTIPPWTRQMYENYEAALLECQEHRRSVRAVVLTAEEAADLLMLAGARAEEYGTEDDHPGIAVLRARLRAAGAG
jgi:hypothetical protein